MRKPADMTVEDWREYLRRLHAELRKQRTKKQKGRPGKSAQNSEAGNYDESNYTR